MKSRLRLKSYTLQNGQYIPHFEEETCMGPLLRTTSQAGLRTISQPNISSDDNLSVHSSVGNKAFDQTVNPSQTLNISKLSAISKGRFVDNPENHHFKKKMLDMLEQSEPSFSLQLQERDFYLEHYQEKYQTLEQRYFQMQSQLAQATARLRFSAMTDNEHKIEIRQKDTEINSLQFILQDRTQQIANLQVLNEELVRHQIQLSNRERQQQNTITIQNSTQGIEKYKQQIASLQRQIQRKDFTISRFEKEEDQRFTFLEQQHYQNGKQKPIQSDTNTQCELQNMKRLVISKEEQCRNMNYEINQIRTMYEQIKAHGEMNHLRAEEQADEVRLLQQQNSRLLGEITVLQQSRRAMEQHINLLLNECTDKDEKIQKLSNEIYHQQNDEPNTQLTRSRLLLEVANRQNQLLEHRITEITKLLVERDNDNDSQLNLINILQEELKLSSQCRNQLDGNDMIQKNIQLINKCANSEHLFADEQMNSKRAIQSQSREFRQAMAEKEGEIDQLHRYIGKLQEIVDLVQEKERGRMVNHCQIQTECEQDGLKISRNPSEVSLRNAKLFKGIAQIACQTEVQSRIEHDRQSEIIKTESSCQGIQTKYSEETSSTPKKQSSPKSASTNAKYLVAQKNSKRKGRTLLNYTLLATAVIFLFIGLLGITN